MTKDTLNIAIIVSSRKWIGEAAHCVDLYRCLAERGNNVILVCRRGYAIEEYARKHALRYRSLAMKGGFNGVDDLRDLLGLRRIIKKHKIDLLHCHRGKDHWLAVAASLSVSPHPAVIRTRHVITPVHNHIFNRWLYAKATDYIIGVSEQAMASFGNLSNSILSKSRVIYSSVDSEKFNPSKRNEALRAGLVGKADADSDTLSPQTKLIGIVARLQNIKGQHYFIRAAKNVLMKHPHARFFIIGTGREGKVRKLKKYAREIGIDQEVSFIGFREDIDEVIAALDVGVIASLGSEGSSRIAFEYMASGVPIVATNVGGVPEIVDDGKTGIVIEPGNIEQMSAAIIRVLDNSRLRENLIANGLTAARTRFNRQRWLDETTQVYCEAIKQLKSKK